MLSKIIRNFVAKMVAGRTDDGIMITLPDPKKVDFQTAMLEDLLMRNGIDPQLIKTEDELKNIINQIEAVNKQKLQQAESGIRNTESAKVFDLEGQQIPPGSRIMGGKAIETEAEIAARLKAENEKGLESLKQKMAKEKARTQRISGNLRSDNMNRTEIGKPKLDEDEYDYYREILGEDGEYDYYPVKGDETKEFLEAMVKEQQDEINYMRRLYDKGALDPKPGERGRKKFLDRKAQKGDKMSQEEIEELKKLSEEQEDLATGGRVGLKAGMSRRAFLALMGSAGAGIGATKTGLLKLFGKEGTKEIIKTPPVAGKPEWFDSLVNKVITQGDDVTKKFSVQDRQVVHSLKIDDMDDVTVYRNLDDGQIRVSYDSPNNMGEQPVELVFKPGMADETTKGKPADEFYAVEAEPRGVRTGPDDYEIEFDGENLASNVDELISDTSKLKQIATNKKPTMQEFVTSKNKKDQTRTLNEDQLEQAEYLETKYGPGPESPEEFASGGIARMLGE